MRAVDARGKHLFLRFEGGLAIHSHLRMTGTWSVLRDGAAGRAPHARVARDARATAREVVQFDGPVLELMTEARVRIDPRHRRASGPTSSPPSSTPSASCAGCARTTRRAPIGDALIDQRTIAGIGNLWKTEGCFAAGDRPVAADGRVSDEEALAIVEAVRPRMQQLGRATASQRRDEQVYGRDGRAVPALRRAARIRRRGQGDDNRTTYWCPACQR